MKLNDEQAKVVEERTGLQPIPDDNPAMSQLKENFGDHTFYVDDQGLYVLEATEEESDQDDPAAAQAVQIASWTDENKTALQAHEPQATDAQFKLKRDE